MGGAKIIGFTFPEGHGGILKSATESKTNRPGIGGVLTNGSEVLGSNFCRLTAAEEENAGEVAGKGVAENGGSSHADSLGSGGGRAIFAAGNHISLENTAAEINMALFELCEDTTEDAVSSGGTFLDGIAAVPENV